MSTFDICQIVCGTIIVIIVNGVTRWRGPEAAAFLLGLPLLTPLYLFTTAATHGAARGLLCSAAASNVMMMAWTLANQHGYRGPASTLAGGLGFVVTSLSLRVGCEYGLQDLLIVLVLTFTVAWSAFRPRIRSQESPNRRSQSAGRDIAIPSLIYVTLVLLRKVTSWTDCFAGLPLTTCLTIFSACVRGDRSAASHLAQRTPLSQLPTIAFLGAFASCVSQCGKPIAFAAGAFASLVVVASMGATRQFKNLPSRYKELPSASTPSADPKNSRSKTTLL